MFGSETFILRWRVRLANAAVQHRGDAREPQQQAAVMGPHPRKINLISCGPLAHVSDIKLIRTDTTLDLSQKAEKGMLCIVASIAFYRCSSQHYLLLYRCGI